MLIKTLPVGHLGTNCYVVTDEQTLNCAVIDPGEESNTILDYIESNHLHCKLILLTHGHFDHVGAVYAVAEETKAVTYMNKKDDARYAGNPFMAFRLPENGRFYDEGDVVELDSLRFEVFATPPAGCLSAARTPSSPGTPCSAAPAAAPISPAATWISSC